MNGKSSITDDENDEQRSTFDSLGNNSNNTSLKQMIPFEIEWSFGWNSENGLLNISRKEMENVKLRMLFVSAQAAVVFEYDMKNKTKSMNILNGHRNIICSFDADSDGRWLVTADKGNDESMLTVWDSYHGTPIFTLFKTKVSIVKFSPDSKYLITVTPVNVDGEQVIEVWDWTLGPEKPTQTKVLDKSFDPVIHISCCRENPNFFCFTTKKCVFFMTLVENAIKSIIYVPNRGSKKIKYDYTQSTYITNFRQVVSASTGGIVTVWDDTNYNLLKFQDIPVTNNKRYLKAVKLDNHSITTIIYQKYIVTGNTNGDIFFYDESLSVLFHLNKFVGDSIVSISMLNERETPKEKNENINTIPNKTGYWIKNQVLRNDNSRSKSLECSGNKGQIGTSYTGQQEFKCETFLISTSNGKIFQVDISKQSFIQIFEQNEEFITALEVHSKQPYVIFGNSFGRLGMYDYEKKKLLTSNTINNKENIQDNKITCIKYSADGFHLCCGCTNGSFWFIDPCLLTPIINKPFKYNNSPIQHITFSDSSNYVVYTDNLFGIYLYGITSSEEITIDYYGCYEVHTDVIRSISITESETNLMIYSIGADHRIAVFDLDKKQDEELKLAKTMKIDPWNEPQCMMKSTIASGLNLIISGSDSRLHVWDDQRCIRTTRGVNLKSPISVMKESPLDNTLIFFCNNTDIGILRQPIDGNPYKNIAIVGSATKLIDFCISSDNKYLFSISENSTSAFMWSVHTSCLHELENEGGTGLIAYSKLLDGGIDGSEIKLIKEYFYCIQLMKSSIPGATVVNDFVDVCDISFLMRAMGYYPSEVEISTMIHEMCTRCEDKIGHPNKVVTLEEFIILYLNYKPQIELKYSDVRQVFDEMVLSDKYANANGQIETLTRESFVHMMTNLGEKIDPRELEILIHTLLKSTSDIPSGSSQNIDSILSALPSTFTFEELMHNLLGFKD